MKLENLESAILLQNNIPLDDFCGLPSTEVHLLLYDTFGTKSLLRLKSDIDDVPLDSIPFLRLTEEFLKIVEREQGIKLTPHGALPRRALHEVYSYRFIPERMIDIGVSKLSREVDSPSIQSMHFNTQAAGLVRKANSRLTVTKRGQGLLATNNRLELFRQILMTFTNRFNWASNDLYDNVPIGQLGWGYSICFTNLARVNKT